MLATCTDTACTLANMQRLTNGRPAITVVITAAASTALWVQWASRAVAPLSWWLGLLWLAAAMQLPHGLQLRLIP
jgi:hypothetical protein